MESYINTIILSPIIILIVLGIEKIKKNPLFVNNMNCVNKQATRITAQNVFFFIKEVAFQLKLITFK